MNFTHRIGFRMSELSSVRLTATSAAPHLERRNPIVAYLMSDHGRQRVAPFYRDLCHGLKQVAPFYRVANASST